MIFRVPTLLDPQARKRGILLQNRHPVGTVHDAETHSFGNSRREAEVYDTSEMTRDDV